MPPDLRGDVVRGRGRDLHEARGAGVRRLVAEVRLGVDDAGDQRGVQALVAACWRMMSSWRSGSATSCTARRQHGAISARRSAATATTPRAGRRRRGAGARRASGGAPGRGAGGARWPCACSSLVTSACQGRRTTPARASPTIPSLRTTYVARAAFSSCGAGARRARRPRRGRARPRARRGPPRRRRRRSWRRRAPPAPPRTAAASRRRGARRRRRARDLLAPLGDPRADQRPQQALEPGALLGRGEGVPRDRGAVDDAAGRDLRPPALDDRVADLVGARTARARPRRWTGWPRPGARARPARSTCRRPRPPVSPTNGTRGCDSSGSARRRRRRLLVGLRRLLGVGLASASASRLGLGSALDRGSPRPRPPRGSSARPESPRRRRSSTGRLRRRRPRQAELRHVVEVAASRRRALVRPRGRGRGRIWSSTRLTDSDSRRRSESISRIFTLHVVARAGRSRAGSRRGAGRARRCARGPRRRRGSPRRRRR